MDKLFGALILSFIFTSALSVPFINLLYTLSFRRKRVLNETEPLNAPSLTKLHGHKVGTPTGGGILILSSTFLFSFLFYFFTDFYINWTATILFVTMFLFGLLGFYDDVRKMVKLNRTSSLFALPAYTKLGMQIAAAVFISFLLYKGMAMDYVRIPFGGFFDFQYLELGIWFIPFAAFVIVATSNAFNITDGLDGLSTGLLMVSLSAFWYLATFVIVGWDVMLFIAVMMGALAAFLYFNIYPARVIMGDTGSMALGAMLAVIAFMTDQVLVLPIIGGVFVLEGASSLIQILSKKFRNGKRVFRIAPLHFHFQSQGWDETKVTMRFWLFGIILAFVGLFIATFNDF